MKKQLTKFSVHQSSKVIAIIYFVFVALFAFPWGIFVAVKWGVSYSIILFLFPFFYLIFGYIGFAIFFFIYNLVAATFGGLEFISTECECECKPVKQETLEVKE